MKTPRIYFLALIALTFITLNTYGQDTPERPAREKWELVTMQGTVTAVNKETREITLKDVDGNLATVTAGDAVERFDEIAINDVITFEYYKYLKAEFRKPTPEEIAEPLVVVAEGGKAPEGVDPAAVVGAVVKAVVSIEVLDRPNMTATVRGPRGNYVTIQMEDEALIVELNIGQVVILTYAEAVAVSLTKVATATPVEK
jgi:kynureninase